VVQDGPRFGHVLLVDVHKVQLVNVGVHKHVAALLVEIGQLLVTELHVLVVFLVLAVVRFTLVRFACTVAILVSLRCWASTLNLNCFLIRSKHLFFITGTFLNRFIEVIALFGDQVAARLFNLLARSGEHLFVQLLIDLVFLFVAGTFCEKFVNREDSLLDFLNYFIFSFRCTAY